MKTADVLDTKNYNPSELLDLCTIKVFGDVRASSAPLITSKSRYYRI
jgi:hypothetical protein